MMHACLHSLQLAEAVTPRHLSAASSRWILRSLGRPPSALTQQHLLGPSATDDARP